MRRTGLLILAALATVLSASGLHAESMKGRGDEQCEKMAAQQKREKCRKMMAGKHDCDRADCPMRSGKGDDCDREDCPKKEKMKHDGGGADCPLKGKMKGEGDRDDCPKKGKMKHDCDRADCPKKGKMKHGYGGDIAFLISSGELDLSDGQKADLEGIRRGFEEEAVDIRKRMKTARKELEELLEKDDVDMGAVERKVREISELKGELILKAVMTRLETRKVLTKEQLEKARELIEKRREK